MKIVRFRDGQYGVRRGNWFVGYSFICLQAFRRGERFWYCRLIDGNPYIRGSYSQALEAFGLLQVAKPDWGTPVTSTWRRHECDHAGDTNVDDMTCSECGMELG